MEGILELVGLFCLSMIIGIIAPMSGLGGGVIFTPTIMAFTPVHPDIVRGASLLLAMTDSAVTAKSYVRRGLANFKLALLFAVPRSLTAALGAIIGLWVTTLGQGVAVVKGALGVLILVTVFLLIKGGRRVEWPECRPDRLARLFGLSGSFWEASLNKRVEYHPTNTLWGLLGNSGVGFLSGFFGLGAGWANVPLLNLVMCLPLKATAATSIVLMGMSYIGAVLVYVIQGHLIPLFALPCLLGASLGAAISARLLPKVRAGIVRQIVIGVLLFTGIKLLLAVVGL